MPIEIKLPNGTAVPAGSHPLVIIGPNGVGKTQLGVAIAKANNAERIAALRNVEIGNIPMQRLKEASQGVQNALQEVLASHWRQSYELQTLLAEILAEDRESAVKYREHMVEQAGTEPPKELVETRLRKLARIWNRHFPGRTMTIDYDPQVQRVVDGNKVTYPIAQMSEGERTALYLAARVVSCTRPILVVDEPESFFHPLLAKRLWNDLEEAVADTRMVYITHDIPFALSRSTPQFAIARSEKSADLVPLSSAIPGEVIAQVLGAASFSVSATRLIFCEGDADSLDAQIFAAWHDCPGSAVVPVGSCQAVRECVAAFNSGKVTAGLKAIGYIDRDGWPDADLTSDPNVRPLQVSEVEGLLCMEPVFTALGRYFGINPPDLPIRYQTFLTAAKKTFVGPALHKEILNRAKKVVEVEQRSLLNPIKPNPDLAAMRAAFIGAAPVNGWPAYLTASFDSEAARLSAALATPEAFLRDYPAKQVYGAAMDQVGVKVDTAIRTLGEALRLPQSESQKNQKLATLRDEIVACLSASLWPRIVS